MKVNVIPTPAEAFPRQHRVTVEIDGMWGTYRSDMWDREVTAFLAELPTTEGLSDLYCARNCWCEVGE